MAPLCLGMDAYKLKICRRMAGLFTALHLCQFAIKTEVSQKLLADPMEFKIGEMFAAILRVLAMAYVAVFFANFYICTRKINASVIEWVESTFRPTKERKKIMKGVEWGPLNDKFKDEIYDFKLLDNEVARLVKDDDVTNKKGIYPYLLTRDERNLSIRAFTDNQKIKAYERQLGVCPICKQHFELSQMEADHITPWCEGGPTIDTNCQMLCRDCNRRKSDK